MASVLELVVDAPVMLQALGSACIPHARCVTCTAALGMSQLHLSHVAVLVKQESLELPLLLVWWGTHRFWLHWRHAVAGEDSPIVNGMGGWAVTSFRGLALVPLRVILVEWMALLHGMSLTLMLILNMKACESHKGRMAFHVVLVDLGPQLHLPVATCGADLAKKWRFTRVSAQSRSAAKPAVVGAVNGVKLIECAVPAVTAHLTTSLTLAINITVTV